MGLLVQSSSWAQPLLLPRLSCVAKRDKERGERESENEYEKSWSLVPLLSSQQQVQVIRSVCECVIVIDKCLWCGWADRFGQTLAAQTVSSRPVHLPFGNCTKFKLSSCDKLDAFPSDTNELFRYSKKPGVELVECGSGCTL